MSTTFLERNKKKSAWAALLLFLRWKKGLGPLLLLVMLIMLVFISPSNILGFMISGLDKMPFGGHRLAVVLAAATHTPLNGEKHSFSELMAALKSARTNGSDAWGLYGGGRYGRNGAGGAGGDSLGMVRGSQADLMAGGSAEDKLGGGKSIKGVLSANEAKEAGNGVQLSDDDLQANGANGLVGNAAAGGFGGAGGMGVGAGGAGGVGGASGANSSAFIAGAGAYATRDTLTGGNVGVANSSTKGPNVLDGKGVPSAGGKVIPGADGKISRNDAARAITSRHTAMNANAIHPGGKALAQLSDGRARAQVARDPLCTADNGCPPEYAMTNTGAVYDGNKIGAQGPGVLVAGPAVTGVDDINTAVPTVPDDTNLDGLQHEADQIQKDAEACRKASEDPVYGKEAQGAHTKRVTELSEEMKGMDCGGGGCSKSKKRRCEAKGDEMKQECRIIDSLQEQQYNHCPLMQKDGPYQHQDCH